ncbi:sphingomyelin synthase 1, putative [Plasmodium malariae]|uniref:Sphingomyelin synthase 1, putative n=1 Tax=Plasmodium malariae TaxID=5858 RepID=A0A1C3KZH9_PLAMA|nr:sphingomyelin synthase 1, putative [Plasmodium malariae]
MTDRNKNLRSPFSNRTSKNKTEKTSNIGENDTNIPKSENIDFSIEVKNSFNKDKVNNHKSNIHDVNDEDCKRIASFTDKGEKIKDRLYTSSDIEDDDLIDNLGSNDNIGMKQVKNSSARKRIYRVFYIRLFYALLLGIFGVLMQCYFIILSDSNYTMGDAPLKDRIHEIFIELPPYLNTITINGCILFLLIFTFFIFGHYCLYIFIQLCVRIYIYSYILNVYIYFLFDLFDIFMNFF